MQLESVGCSLSNNSCDGEVPAEAESPRMKKTQVSITSLDVATNPLETIMQSDSVGCMLSNTSCDGEVPDEMESQCNKQTQVSITSRDVATNLSETQMSTLEGGSLASKSSDIMYWSTSPAEITEGVSPRFASIVYQGSPRSDTNGNNMKPEAIGCSLSNTSCDGDVPDKIESPRKNNTLVSSTSLINIPKLSMFEGRSFVSKVDEIVSWSKLPTEINEGLSHVCASTTCQGSSHTDTNGTNRQPEAVGYSLSNTSCDGEVLDEIEGPVKSKTQVSAASLVVARNPSDSKSSMFEKSLLEIGDPPSFTVQSPVASATSLDGSIKIDLDTADMSSFSCNAGTSIEKKTCDCQTAVSLESDSNPLITKSSRFVGLVTVESASPIAVKERGSTGDSLSHSRVSLGTGAVEARKNSMGCERRSESPSLNKSLEKGKKRKLKRSGPECSDLRSDEPLPKFPCLFTETEEHQAKSPGTEVTIEHPPAEDLGEPTDPETSTGKNISQQPKGKTRKRKRSAPESPDTSERESEEPLQKSRCLVMETKEPQVVSPQAEEPRVKVEIGADPQSPEALEYAHFCLRNAYHALLGATAKNITIQTQVTVEPSQRNRGRRNRIKRVWNGESFVPETEVQVQSEPYKRRRRRRRN
ncbi:uncharacterized protein LOC113681438 [Pocillopora damicornis]|uniref:uncharacterized protein LOC113681438 n=1 Tax=Pocillopora damicornis TaxID=46731 RepID=UPI000F54D7E9|nr:uncharacterized protein LOC113681438 [Pocillopora damicornis]